MGVEVPIILGILFAYYLYRQDRIGMEKEEKEGKRREKHDDGPWFF